MSVCRFYNLISITDYVVYLVKSNTNVYSPLSILFPTDAANVSCLLHLYVILTEVLKWIHICYPFYHFTSIRHFMPTLVFSVSAIIKLNILKRILNSDIWEWVDGIFSACTYKSTPCFQCRLNTFLYLPFKATFFINRFFWAQTVSSLRLVKSSFKHDII
jgi:hypothetical protein